MDKLPVQTSTSRSDRRPPLAPALPLVGAGAHAIPLYYPISCFMYYNTIASGAPQRRGKTPGASSFF